MQQFQLLYERFLDCGYSPDEFYHYSINEVVDLIKSYERRKENDAKKLYQQAITVLDLFGANLIEKVIFTLSRNKEDIKFSLLDYFPELFPGREIIEKKENSQTKEKKLSPEMEEYKAKRMYHAYRVNQARKREGDK